jgi:hypothetical protein
MRLLDNASIFTAEAKAAIYSEIEKHCIFFPKFTLCVTINLKPEIQKYHDKETLVAMS